MTLEYTVSYRTKDKSIQCIIAYKDNGQWKTKSKQGFKTQKESKPWQEKTLEKLKENIKVPVDYRGTTFKEFKEIFLKDKEKEYAYNSIEIFETVFGKFKKIDNIPLIEISYIHLKPCFDDMLDELGESTIKDYFNKLKTTFNHAIENYKIIKENPIDIKQYKFPVVEKKKDKIKALTEFELEDLLSKLDGSDYWICFFAGKCGLRLGEINGLLDDTSINLENGIIHVKRQWKKTDKKGNHDLGTLKTKNSYREVPLPIKYIPEFKKYMSTCIKDINNRIFIDNSNQTTGARLAYKFKKLNYDISMHDLRHTYVTILIKKGFDFKTIAELIGDTVEMVIKTYSHFTEDMFESAQDRINKIL